MTSSSIIDALALMTWQDRKCYFRKHSLPFRVVAIRHKEGESWFRYVAQTPPTMRIAEACSAVYAARWESELTFKIEERIQIERVFVEEL